VNHPSLFAIEPPQEEAPLSQPLKPMLSAKIKTEEDFAGIRFPRLCSPKLDGIRQTVQDAIVLSRTLKQLPNKHIRATFGCSILDGLDGEFIDGPLTASDVFNSTTSVVMSEDKPIEEISLNIFDDLSRRLDPFNDRLASAIERVAKINKHWPHMRIRGVEHTIINSMAELLAYEEGKLDEGYEGIMLRDPFGRYKHGRSTLKEGGLAAIKRFVDAEAVVIDVYEQEENTNEKQTNELGRSKRSSAKAGMVGKNTLGGFTVVANPEDKETIAVFGATPFNVGTGEGLTAALRQELWNTREAQAGRIVKFKYQLIGSKDKPRLPIWLGFRDPMDMDR
jgi:DNA ligase 1